MTKRANYLFVEKQGEEYLVSMTPELQDDVGTVGFLEFTETDTVQKDDVLANVEASKTVLEVLSPLAGRVVARNQAAEGQPDLLNSAKTEENWLVKLTDVDQAEFDKLEDA